jgi:chaperonin GroES
LLQASANTEKTARASQLDVHAGDRVLFGKYGGSEIKVDGEDLLIMREDEILGVISRAGAAAGGKKSK